MGQLAAGGPVDQLQRSGAFARPSEPGVFSIRSDTHAVPIGDRDVTIAEMLSDADYNTGAFGRWHLGSEPGGLPNDQGFMSGTASCARRSKPSGRAKPAAEDCRWEDERL